MPYPLGLVRIGLVSPYSWSYQGGVNRHVEALAEEFLGRGHDVRVLAPVDPPGRVSRVLHRAGAEARELPDYVVSAWLMAAFLNGLDEAETDALTEALLHSGRVFDWSALGRPSADKHSTGGVGDKISLILAPLVAACDVLVPMVSGRGLGHTGGTLDKLESIPGFRTQLPLEAMRAQLDRIGVVMIGQGPDLAPADGRDDVEAHRAPFRRPKRGARKSLRPAIA